MCKRELQDKIARLQKELEDAEASNTHLHSVVGKEAHQAYLERQKAQEEIAQLRKELESMKAAHWLLANDEAFIAPKDGSIFFVMEQVSENDQCQLALNMNDVFVFACADCEPFEYEIAPELKRIAQEKGWAGLIKWVSEKRGKLPIRPLIDYTPDQIELENLRAIRKAVLSWLEAYDATAPPLDTPTNLVKWDREYRNRFAALREVLENQSQKAT